MLVGTESVLKALTCDPVTLLRKMHCPTDPILSGFVAFPQLVGTPGHLHCRDNANVNN